MTDSVANIDELPIGPHVIGFHCLDSYIDSNNSQILILIHDQDHQQLFPKENMKEYFCLMWQLCVGPALGEREEMIGSLRLTGEASKGEAPLVLQKHQSKLHDT